jgi:hypothetical protein
LAIESEKLLERKLKKTVERELGGQVLKLLSTYKVGLPDRLCILPGGRVFFAEVKTTKQKPTKIQLLVHRQLQALGFNVEIIDTSEQIQNLIKHYG